MLAVEERRLMLLDADAPYAAQIVEPIFVSERPSSPDVVSRFGVVTVGWTLAGAFLALVIALVRAPARKESA